MSETPPPYGSSKQLNIRLPERLHRELKAKCALDGLSLAEAIEELVRVYLADKVTLTRKTERLAGHHDKPSAAAPIQCFRDK